MPKRSRLAERQKPSQYRTDLSGIGMAYMAYARFENLSRFRILFGIRCSVFGSPLYSIHPKAGHGSAFGFNLLPVPTI